jgi:hypothetical protein
MNDDEEFTCAELVAAILLESGGCEFEEFQVTTSQLQIFSASNI